MRLAPLTLLASLALTSAGCAAGAPGMKDAPVDDAGDVAPSGDSADTSTDPDDTGTDDTGTDDTGTDDTGTDDTGTTDPIEPCSAGGGAGCTVDGDGDGAPLGEDCDDGNPSVDWAGSWEGDVEAADLAGLCDRACALEIRGSVYVERTDLEDLQALSCVTAIGGELVISDNNNLRTLEGLSRLEVTGALTIENNFYLLQGSSFDALSSIVGDLTVDENPVLDTLALPALRQVNGLRLRDDPSLTWLHLPSLISVQGDMEISDDPMLYQLDDLGLLSTVGGDLEIRRNINLETISAPSLRAVHGNLILDSDLRLSDIRGLTGIIEIGGDLSVWTTDMEGLLPLHNINAIGGDVSILNNHGVHADEFDAFIASVGSIGGEISYAE